MLKIYALIWVVGVLAVAAFYFAGYFTPLVAIVFGFLSFGAVFMGMMSVLPSIVGHHPAAKH